MEKATLSGVKSINYDGNTLEVTFEDSIPLEELYPEVTESLETPEQVPEGPAFDPGHYGHDTNNNAPITVVGVSRAKAGEYYIDEKDQFVDEYNYCDADEYVYHVTYRDGEKRYALPESRIE